MNLKEILNEIEKSMTSITEYSGPIPLYALSNALTAYTLFHKEAFEARDPTRLRSGMLEDHEMIIGANRIGDERAIVLAPAPTDIDQGAAILTSSGVVIAAYTNVLDGYESVAAWDTIEIPEPMNRADIYRDLFVGPHSLRTGTSLIGIEIAARYLLETKNGLPLGLEPERI